MRTFLHPLLSCLTPIAVVCLLASTAAAQFQTYELIEFPELPGNPVIFDEATGINDIGQVVGISSGQAFLWTDATGIQDLGVGLSSLPGPPNGRADSAVINASGNVFATIIDNPQEFVSFSISADGSILELQNGPQGASAEVLDANDLGVAVGRSGAFFTGFAGAGWLPNDSSAIEIPTLRSIASITNNTIITGATSNNSAFVAIPGFFLDLGVPNGFETTNGVHVNSSGRVVLASDGITPIIFTRPLVWNVQAGTVDQLPIPAGLGAQVSIDGANEHGLIVGAGAPPFTFSTDRDGLIWDAKTGATARLNDLVTNLNGRSIFRGNDINETGMIAVAIELPSGTQRAGVLMPIGS